MNHKTSTLCLIFLSLAALALAKDSFLSVKGVTTLPETIPQANVADLIQHMSGLTFVNEEVDRTTFPEVDIFSLPKANLFIALDSVSHELISNMENAQFFESSNTAEIIKTSYPEDSLSLLTSIVTGEEWEVHGIVGASWKATDYLGVKAFSQQGQRLVPNIADRLSHSSEGAARTLIISGSQKMAYALGVHSELHSGHADWNNQIIYYHPTKGLIKAHSEEKIGTNTAIRSAAQKRMVKIETKEGFILAAELYAIENLPRLLEEMKMSPYTDFIGIGLSSINILANKFGQDSKQVTVAMELLDTALANMYEKLNEMYDGKMITEIVGLGSNTAEHNTNTQDQQIRKVFAIEEDYWYYYYYAYDADAVSAFQTKLWVAVGFVIAVIIGLLYLVKMDMLYETSILYKITDGPRPIPDVR